MARPVIADKSARCRPTRLAAKQYAAGPREVQTDPSGRVRAERARRSPRPGAVPRFRAMTREWDAASYDRIATPMTRMGSAVLDRLPLDGRRARARRRLRERAGHAATARAAAARPGRRARRVAPDGRAGARNAAAAGLDDRAEYVVADLGQPIPISEPVDAVLSTATFHWVLDHDALFRNLAAVMRPGAPLVAQCGGGENIARVRAVLRDLGETWAPWNFAWPDETRARLEAAGFDEIEVWLHDEPVEIPPAELRDFLRTIILGSNLARKAPDEREPFVEAVAERLADGRLDYVRLNILARRAAG